MDAKIYNISAAFARTKSCPRTFLAIPLKETAKAIYLYGHGATDPEGGCARCGRRLTHPGSILIGIGPECLQDWGARDIVLDNITEDQKTYLKSLMRERKVDGWFPKTVIKKEFFTDEGVPVPQDHPLFKREADPLPTPSPEAPPIPSGKSVELKGGNYILKFEFNRELVDEIKKINGRSWNPTDKHWIIRGTEENIQKLIGLGFSIDRPEKAKEEEEKPMKTVQPGTGGKFVVIAFHYDASLVDRVRTLEGRKWDAVKKIWTAWRSIENLRNLKSWGFQLEASLEEDLKKDSKPLEEKIQEDVKISKELRTTLLNSGVFPYQVDGISWLNSVEGNGLLADEQGLGKTLQALYFLKLNPDLRPACVVVPASLKINWEREALKWIGPKVKVVILKGKKPNKKDLKGKEIFIINYDILSAWLPVLCEAGIKILIGDEVQKVKNPKTQQTQAFKELAKNVGRVIGLSGTPILSRPVEFYTFLNILDPVNFNSWIRYIKRYCGAYQDSYGWHATGATNVDELFQKINGKLMLRRKKEEVMKELPEKRFMVVPMEITNQREYQRAADDLISWVAENFGRAKAEKTSNAEALARFNYLKQIAAEGKMEFSINWISDFLESNGKLVIFCEHLSVIDQLMEKLVNFNPVKVDGRCNAKSRQDAVDRFQKDDSCRVFIGNAAAETGLTLTAASDVVHLEFPWTPAAMDQRTDRIHRIGQTANSVGVWHLVAANTIEEEIIELLDKKRETLTAVLDGKEVAQETLLMSLIESFSSM